MDDYLVIDEDGEVFEPNLTLEHANEMMKDASEGQILSIYKFVDSNDY